MSSLGYKHTKEAKERIRVAMKRRIISVATREKLSKSKTGINNYAFGKPAHNRGKSSSKESKRKNRESHLGKIAGEKHWNWKGGRSKHYKTGYYSTEYKNWRRKVFDRDSFTCQGCGKCEYITAHHIKSFARYPSIRYEISNGITLCEVCHSKTDNYKGRAKKII